MKRIIEGVTYNTDTSTLIAFGSWRNSAGNSVDSMLYQTRGGAFFREDRERTGRGEFDYDASCVPLSEEQAREWVMKGQVDLVDAEVFGEPPEAEAEREPSATIYVRVPIALKDRIEGAAETDTLSVNSWMIRCSERCMERTGATINVYVTSWPEKANLPVEVDRNGTGYEVTPSLSAGWERRELVAKLLLHPQAPISDVAVGLRRVANEMVRNEANFKP